MLKPQQIPELKQTDRALYTLARTMCDVINKFALQMGVDPKPASQVEIKDALPAPNPPKSITIEVVSLVVFIVLEAAPEATDSVFYFVERSTTEKFQEITRYSLGHGLQLAVPELPGTTYWRAFCRYQMSGPSQFITWQG